VTAGGASGPRDQAVELATFWQRERLAIGWTAGKTGDDAKAVKRKGWNDAPVIALDANVENEAGKIATRLKTKNPVVVAAKSNCVLVDCDSAEDVALFKSFGPPRTRTVKTSKGRHAYYRPDVGMEPGGIYFENGVITPKSDCYLVTPPAIHDSGHVYEWESDAEIAVLPADVHRAMLDAAGARQDEERERIAADPEAKVTAGGRHDLLLREAGRLANVGSLDEEGVVAALTRINETRCDPPKTATEVKRLAREAVEHWREKSAVDRLASESGGRPKRRGFIESLDDGVLPSSTEWLPGFDLIVPEGELMNLIAVGGTGKGFFVVMLAAMLKSDVLYSGTEDNADRLKKRLDAAGSRAGLKRLWADERRTRLSFPRDVDLVADAIEETGAKLVVIDSGPGHLDRGLKNNDVEDVRKMVDPLAAVCERTGATILVVLHPPKSGEVLSGLGSGAWDHASRHSLFMVPDDEDKNVRHVVVSKTNIGQLWYGRMLRFTEVPVPVLDRKLGMETTEMVGRLEWLDGESTKSLPDLLRKQVGGTRGRPATERTAAKELLRGMLTGEGEESSVIKAKIAAAVGCSEKTVKNAFDELCAEGFADWHRELNGQFGADGQRYLWHLTVPGADEGTTE
jgi:hypothetical protein